MYQLSIHEQQENNELVLKQKTKHCHLFTTTDTLLCIYKKFVSTEPVCRKKCFIFRDEKYNEFLIFHKTNTNSFANVNE